MLFFSLAPGWKGPQGARASRPTRKDLPTAKRKGGREAPPATRKGGRDAPAPAPARKGSREAPAPTGKEGPEGASAGTGQRHQALQKGAEGCVMDGKLWTGKRIQYSALQAVCISYSTSV